jgi:hypothetical protein
MLLDELNRNVAKPRRPEIPSPCGAAYGREVAFGNWQIGELSEGAWSRYKLPPAQGEIAQLLHRGVCDLSLAASLSTECQEAAQPKPLDHCQLSVAMDAQPRHAAVGHCHFAKRSRCTYVVAAPKPLAPGL